MHINYIKSLAESYVIDKELYKKNITPDQLSNEFSGLLKEIWENNIEVYDMVNNFNKFEQQTIFTNYFDIVFINEDIEEINESIAIVLTASFWIKFIQASIFSLFVLSLSKPLSRATMKLANTLARWTNSLGKVLSKAGKQTQLAYSIIQMNAKKCYNECDFNKEDAGIFDYLASYNKETVQNTIGKIVKSEKNLKKLNCLRECYIKTIRELVKLNIQTYFNCLKNTGDLAKMPLEKDFTSFQRLIIKSGLSNACDDLRRVTAESLDRLDDVLNIAYDANSDKQQLISKFKAELMEEIYQTQRYSQQNNTKNYSSNNTQQNQSNRRN